MIINIKENKLEWVKNLKEGDTVYIKRVRNENQYEYILSTVSLVEPDKIKFDTDFTILIMENDIEIIPTKYTKEVDQVFIFQNNEDGLKLKKIDQIESKYPNLGLNIGVAIPISFIITVLLSNLLGNTITLKALGILFGQTILTSFCLGYLYYFIKKMILNIKYNKLVK